MKKQVILFSLPLLSALSAIAQLPAKHSAVPVSRAKAQVRHFQEQCRYHPSSFIIKAYGNTGSGIGDYLLNTYCTPGNRFLHVYFGEKEKSGNELNEQVLVITGAGYAKNLNTGRKHLANDWQNSPVWVTTVSQPGCCVPFDCDFDYNDTYTNKGCTMSDIGDGLETHATAAAAIRAFQVRDCNSGKKGDVIFETESFLVNADDIHNYLCRNPHVQYLQFYLAYKPLANETTLFITGLDKRGRHVWSYDDNGVPYLFGNAVNCPNCSIDFDETLDYHVQGARRFREIASQ